jgi:saccharopepsin
MGIEGTGFTSLDTVTIVEGLQIFHHPFQELNSWFNEMYPWGFVHDSVLGLNIGPPPFRMEGPVPTLPSPFQAMISQGVLDANMFSVKLPSPENDDGEIMFGGYNEDAFEGELSTHPIFPPNATQWQIEPNSVTLTSPNGSVLLDESLAGNTAILTTAFSYIMFPQRIGNMIMEHVPIIDDDCWICTSCENVPSLPVISLNLGGREFKLRGEDYTVKGIPFMCDRECCFPIIGPNSEEADSTEIVVGSLFLKKLYTVFDWDARAVHCKFSCQQC